MGDYYEFLGVSRTAPANVVRAAYLALMRNVHSDVGGGDDAVTKRLNEAHDVLSNPVKRAAYDRQLAEAEAAARAEAERRAKKPSGPPQPTVYIQYTVPPQQPSPFRPTRPAPQPPPTPSQPPRPVPIPDFVQPEIIPWSRRPGVRTAWAMWGIVVIVMLLACVAVSWWAVGIALLFALALCVTANCFGTGSPLLGALFLLGSLFLLVVLIAPQVRPVDVEQMMIDRSLAQIPTGTLVTLGSAILLFVLSLAVVVPVIVRARHAETGDSALAELNEFRHIHEHDPSLGAWLVKTATPQNSGTAVLLEGDGGRQISTTLEGGIGVDDLLLLDATPKPVRHLSDDVLSRANRREEELA